MRMEREGGGYRGKGPTREERKEQGLNGSTFHCLSVYFNTLHYTFGNQSGFFPHNIMFLSSLKRRLLKVLSIYLLCAILHLHKILLRKLLKTLFTSSWKLFSFIMELIGCVKETAPQTYPRYHC